MNSHNEIKQRQSINIFFIAVSAKRDFISINFATKAFEDHLHRYLKSPRQTIDIALAYKTIELLGTDAL